MDKYTGDLPTKPTAKKQVKVVMAWAVYGDGNNTFIPWLFQHEFEANNFAGVVRHALGMCEHDKNVFEVEIRPCPAYRAKRRKV